MAFAFSLSAVPVNYVNNKLFYFDKYFATDNKYEKMFIPLMVAKDEFQIQRKSQISRLKFIYMNKKNVIGDNKIILSNFYRITYINKILSLPIINSLLRRIIK